MTNRFFADELSPNIERWVDQGIVDREFWHTAGQAGIMGGAIPEEHGGAGGDMGFESVVIYEQTRTGDCGWGYGIQSIVTHYITAYGTDEQKARWLPGLASGEIVGAIAMTEPGTGPIFKPSKRGPRRTATSTRSTDQKSSSPMARPPI